MATAAAFSSTAWRAPRSNDFSAKSLSKAAVVRAPLDLKFAASQQRGDLPILRRKSEPLRAGNLVGNKNTMAESKSPIVSVDWLYQHRNDPHVKILDASWYMPADHRDPFEEFKKCRLPGALFFDIDGIVDHEVDLPHMLPPESSFAAAASALGLQNADTVVVYDGKGIFSSARVWWMFRVFGHENVYVLDGGLPKWRASAYPTDSSAASADILSRTEASVAATRQQQAVSGGFKTSFQKSLVWSLEQVKKNVEDRTFQLIDARSKARFDGVATEPRKGVRAGHVPGSRCIPFTEVLSQEGTLLPANDLHKAFQGAGLDLESPVVASCGTGVTACILALSLHQLGVVSVPVYDGSWTEWGGRADTVVAVTASSSSS